MKSPSQSAKKPRWRLLARWTTLLALSYAGVLLVMMFLENWLVFRPLRASDDWQPAPAPDIQDVYVSTADGTRIHAWWLPKTDSAQALLYCHGNAGNLSHRGGSILKLREILQCSVLIFDYPGYGKSEGRPSERTCYAAGQAAFDWLTKTQAIDPEQILLYGGSLGGGIAVELACRNPYRALVLAKTFTSLPDVAQDLHPWLPARWLMRNRCDNLCKIASCKKPVFITHGTADSLIPFKHGQALFAAANEPKEFFVLEGGDHNDPLPPQFFRALTRFLEKAEQGGQKLAKTRGTG